MERLTKTRRDEPGAVHAQTRAPRYLDLLDALECSNREHLILVMMVETSFHNENAVLHNEKSLLQGLRDTCMFISKLFLLGNKFKKQALIHRGTN